MSNIYKKWRDEQSAHEYTKSLLVKSRVHSYLIGSVIGFCMGIVAGLIL